jgi:hypothetical protein
MLLPRPLPVFQTAHPVLDCRMAHIRLFIAALALLGVPALGVVARGQAYLPEDNLAYPVQLVVAEAVPVSSSDGIASSFW